MPKKNRIAIYEHLFKEGVMVAKKDFHAPKHPEVESVPNLQVIKALQVSLFSNFLLLSLPNKKFIVLSLDCEKFNSFEPPNYPKALCKQNRLQ